MGVASLKLEGRMKRAEYVAAVTGVYRRAIDTGSVTRDMQQTLFTAFNRQGFTDGYYAGRTGSAMFGVREDTSEDQSWLKNVRQTYETTENALVGVRFEATLVPGSSQLTVTDDTGRSCTLQGPAPEPARVMELSPEALAARLEKTGGTPYFCRDVRCHIAPGLTMSAAAVNALRRDALNQLTALRARRESHPLGKPAKLPRYDGNRRHPGVTVQITSRDQITAALLRMKAEVLYIPLHILAADSALCAELARTQQVCAVLPRIVHDAELPALRQAMHDVRALGVREVLAGNLGLLIPARECGMRIRGDFGLNLYSSASVAVARELELRSACLSFEMTLPQIRDVSKAVPCEIISYGRLPLMVTENCLIRSRTGHCTCHLGSTKLTDKTGADFPVIKDAASCRSVLLNGKKLSWLDRQDDLAKLGLWATRLYFTTENPREVDQVLAAVHAPTPFDPGACTRGLYLRGVE